MEVTTVNPRAVSVRGAAKYLGCSPEHIAAMLRDGKLSSITYGGRKRYLLLEDLDAYLEEQISQSRRAKDVNWTKVKYKNMVSRAAKQNKAGMLK